LPYLTEDQINHFINQVEIPRLADTYPDAIIGITLNNVAALNYLPVCDDESIQIRNQRPDATKRTNYEISLQQTQRGNLMRPLLNPS